MSMFRRPPKLREPEADGEPAVARQPLFSLFNKLALMHQGAEGRAIQIIGTRVGVGASTVSLALAGFATRHDEGPVLLVDADPLHPVPPGAGDCPSLQDAPSPEQAVRSAEGRPGLFLAALTPPAGAGSAAELSIGGLAGIVDRLRSRFRWVVFDSAPAGDLPLALVLSRFVDGTVIVVESESTRLPVVRRLIDEIRANGGTPVGTIINKRRLSIPRAVYRLFR